jgi:hypothetical protein
MAGQPAAAPGREILSYARLRRAHVAHTLRELARRRQSALLAVAALMGPVAVALLEPLGQAVRAAVSPQATIAIRLVFIIVWLGVTTLTVLALREAVFMRGARAFLRALPVSRARHWRGDAIAIVLACAPLLLMVIYGCVRMAMTSTLPDAAAGSLLLAEALVLGVLLQAMLYQVATRAWWRAAIASALLWACGPYIGPWVGLAIGASGLALIGLWTAMAFERAGRQRTSRAMLRHAAPGPARIALAALRHEQGEALALRLGAVAAVIGAGALLAASGGFCTKAWGIGVAQLAACALLLHRVTALVHAWLAGPLAFLYRLRGPRLRALAAAFGLSAAGFATSALASAGTWRYACGALDLEHWRTSLALFGTAFVLVALAAPRLRHAASWVAVLTFGAVALALATVAA